MDDEDEEIAAKEWYQAYLNYLITWVFENKEPAASPMSYQKYVDSKLPF